MPGLTQRTPSAGLVARLLCVSGALPGATGCVRAPTQVTVRLDTDAPRDRTLAIAVTFVNDRGAPTDAMPQQTWVRGGAAGALELPATFALVPAAGGARDAPAALFVSAELQPGAAGQPIQRMRRIARFRFVPNQALQLRLFLPMGCAAQTTGCTGSYADGCTVSERCEEQGQTCGDRAECVSPFVQLELPDAATTGDGAPDAGPTLDAGEAGMDAPLAPDVATDATDAADAPPPVIATRPLSPMSTSTTSTQRPTLRWLPGSEPGLGAIGLTLCRDRALSVMCVDVPPGSLPAGQSAYRPAAPLAPGVWFWQLRGAGVSPQPVWEFVAPARSAPIDTASGIFADVNGDGLADVIVGEPSYSGMTGRVRVYQGGADGVSETRVQVLASPDGLGNNWFGWSVGSAGDLNGDGYGDVVVGRFGNALASVFVYFGSASGLPATPSRTLMASSLSDFLGHSVAGAGDINGDGYGDLVLGAPGANLNTGRVLVRAGSADGALPAMAQFEGHSAGENYGWSVAGAGDVNADGLADIAVGAPQADMAGAAYVMLGTRTGPGAELRLAGAAARDQFGVDVEFVGDTDRDGYDELLVGANGASTSAGRVYVYHGAVSFPPSSEWLRVDGTTADGSLGAAVTGLGDLNGDGYSDFAVGEPNYDPGMGTSGGLYVYLGGAGVPTPAATGVVRGAGDSTGFGQALACAGDVNGDGYADLIVAAPNADRGTGRVYEFLGGATAPGATADRVLLGVDGMGTEFGFSVAWSPAPRGPASARRTWRRCVAAPLRPRVARPRPGIADAP